LQRFPEYGAGWLQLGATLLRLGQPSAANAAFDQALQARPVPVQAVLGKADGLIAQGQPAAAAAWLSENRTRWPDNAGLWHKLGRAHYAAGALPACAKALRRAVGLAPGQAEAWFHLGLVEQDMDNAIAAAQAYRQALAARPSMAEAALNLGISLQDAGDLDAALDAYASAVRLAPAYFNRVAQALTSASTGRLWLDLSALRRRLADRM
jgi:tetratricopeptide (TPR) repeat protein